MSTLNVRICKNCKREYVHKYANKDGSLYHENVEFCSKSCASKHRGSIGCIIPDVGEAALRDKVTKFISGQNKYCTKEEVCTGVGHSCKTLSKHGIKIAEVNRALGFNKPFSVFQNNVEAILRNKYGNIETEKSFDGLVSVKGHSLRVDFYLPDINTVVEADGSHHTKPEHFWSSQNAGQVFQHDSIKETFLRDKGIALVRIPYKRSLKESDVLPHLK